MQFLVVQVIMNQSIGMSCIYLAAQILMNQSNSMSCKYLAAQVNMNQPVDMSCIYLATDYEPIIRHSVKLLPGCTCYFKILRTLVTSLRSVQEHCCNDSFIKQRSMVLCHCSNHKQCSLMFSAQKGLLYLTRSFHPGSRIYWLLSSYFVLCCAGGSSKGISFSCCPWILCIHGNSLNSDTASVLIKREGDSEELIINFLVMTTDAICLKHVVSLTL